MQSRKPSPEGTTMNYQIFAAIEAILHDNGLPIPDGRGEEKLDKIRGNSSVTTRCPRTSASDCRTCLPCDRRAWEVSVRIFSFDAEPEGLYGPPFAIGAVVLGDSDTPESVFGGYTEPINPIHPWVQERLAAAQQLDNHHDTREELLEAFWTFWLANRQNAVCVSDWGSPVESGLMRRCVAVNESERQFLGPTPLHEVSTALLCGEIDPNVDRIAFSGLVGMTKHNPVDDALASAICFRKILRKET